MQSRFLGTGTGLQRRAWYQHCLQILSSVHWTLHVKFSKLQQILHFGKNPLTTTAGHAKHALIAPAGNTNPCLRGASGPAAPSGSTPLPTIPVPCRACTSGATALNSRMGASMSPATLPWVATWRCMGAHSTSRTRMPLPGASCRTRWGRPALHLPLTPPNMFSFHNHVLQRTR